MIPRYLIDMRYMWCVNVKIANTSSVGVNSNIYVITKFALMSVYTNMSVERNIIVHICVDVYTTYCLCLRLLMLICMFHIDVSTNFYFISRNLQKYEFIWSMRLSDVQHIVSGKCLVSKFAFEITDALARQTHIYSSSDDRPTDWLTDMECITTFHQFHSIIYLHRNSHSGQQTARWYLLRPTKKRDPVSNIFRDVT